MKISLYKYLFLILIIIAFSFYPAVSSISYSQSDFISISSPVSSEVYDMLSNVTEEKLRNHVQEIEKFGPHPTGSENLVLVQNYLFNELNKTGLDVKLKKWVLNEKSGNNIEATLKGSKDPESIVIVCAHYDSVEISPGADDDGSGVSSVLTIAEIISKYAFNNTIKMVLFSGEEQGLFGSRVYAKECFENKDNILAVINLDGVGYASDYENGRVIRGLINDDDKWLLNIANTVTDEYSETIDLSIYRYPKVINGDHKAFVDYGYDGIYFLENELNPYYHTSRDKSIHMNFTYLKKVCRLALGTLEKTSRLNNGIKNDDLKISIKGTILSKPAQLSISINNDFYPYDTANVSVNISLINMITGEYVYGMYDSVTYWNITDEIKEKWDFLIGNRFYKFEPFICIVTLRGYNDDIYIFKEVKTYGLAFSTFLFVKPVTK